MKIVLIGNSDLVLYNFRKELISTLIKKYDEVILISPIGDKIQLLTNFGCKHYSWNLKRHSINPFQLYKEFIFLFKLIKKIKPNYILSFTIKPNIFSGIISNILNINFIPNITGLGRIFIRQSLLRSLVIYLYRKVFIKAKVIFLQNKSDFDFFSSLNLFPHKLFLLPGSGVNLEEFKFVKYPKETSGINFLYLGRIIKEKGIYLYIEAAKIIKTKYKNVNFIVAGFTEKKHDTIFRKAIKEGTIVYKGNLINVFHLISNIHCLIQPSFYPEGISNVILESSAVGRPVITSNNSGCIDAVLNNETGFIFKKGELNELINSIEKYITLSFEDKNKFSINSRKFMHENFDRKIVINTYLKYIE